MTLLCLCGYAHEQPVPRICARCGRCWPLWRVAVPVPRRDIALDHR